MATFTRNRFVNKRTGKPLRGLKSVLDRKRNTRVPAAAQAAGIAHGIAMDNEITAFVKCKTPLKTVRAKAVIETILGLYPNTTTVDAQVPVANMASRIATAIDVLATAPGIGDIVIENKYCGPPAKWYMKAAFAVDPSSPSMYAKSTNTHVPRTTHNTHIDQLTSNMLLLARTKRLRTGTVLHGALVVATSTACLFWRHSVVYTPNTNINAPPRQPPISIPAPAPRATRSPPKKRKPSIKRLSAKLFKMASKS